MVVGEVVDLVDDDLVAFEDDDQVLVDDDFDDLVDDPLVAGELVEVGKYAFMFCSHDTHYPCKCI